MGIEAFYQTVYLYTVVVLTLIVASRVGENSYELISEKSNNASVAIVLFAALALFLGQRPTWGFLFGDSFLYKHVYELTQKGVFGRYNQNSEWLWRLFTETCAKSVSLSTYFTIISCAYFGFSFWACRKFTSNNVLVCCLFLLGSISMYTYAVNGLRNGVACSMVLVVIAYASSSRPNYWIAGILAVLVLGLHRSTILPLASLIASIFVIKNFKTAYSIWIAAIILSMIIGNAISSIVINLGYDERVTNYLTNFETSKFNQVGFRWDFLIYSMMPILLGYYVVIKKGIQDRTYTILLNTYTLANAFWVMVIRANYSNRFAYLSWFMYPIVLAYPLLKLDIWGDEQGKYLRQIMLAHMGFTWFMQTFYW